MPDQANPAHAAFDDFRIVRYNLMGGVRRTRERQVHACIFVDPELGRIGLDEADASHLEMKVRVAGLPPASVLRARSLGETRGFKKAIPFHVMLTNINFT